MYEAQAGPSPNSPRNTRRQYIAARSRLTTALFEHVDKRYLITWRADSSWRRLHFAQQIDLFSRWLR